MKRFKIDSFQGHVVFHIEMWSTGKCLTYIFGYLLPTIFCQRLYFGYNCQKLGHAPLHKLASTDPLGGISNKQTGP